ncbi:MAG TPA: DUF6600 domain-containing protein, partial [Anaeromyxobacter sp.]|nr:DUF6600 domain-containing protein [Anaeromyxobacter sp.]
PGAPASPSAPATPVTPGRPGAPQGGPSPEGSAADEGELPATPPPIEEHAAAASPSDGNPTPTLEHFHQALDPHGRWVETQEYGLVWIPSATGAEWRPYANGRWVNTDQGWTFVAAETWGWAPFHYGRWIWYPAHGWAWLPGYEWAPAWVTWRYGAGVVGWAPLGPSGVDVAYYGAPSLWLFVATPYFFRPLVWRHFYPTVRVGGVLRGTYFAGVPRRGVYLSPPRAYFAQLARREAARREPEANSQHHGGRGHGRGGGHHSGR